MFAAAWIVLRPPDFSEVIVFFTSGIPSLAAGEAVMTLLAWFLVAAAVGAALVSVIRATKQAQALRHAISFGTFFLAVGLMLLAIGALQRSLPQASVCCGSGTANIREAAELAG
jgi:hypothetical protein